MRWTVALALALPVAFATQLSDLPGWDEWNKHTHEKLEQLEQQLDAPSGRAPEINVAVKNKSYVVKMDCLGCPFRVRLGGYAVMEALHKGLPTEMWQENPQDNSMLLNFTVNDSEPSLLLNDEPILPQPTYHYPGTAAFQVPATQTKQDMDWILSRPVLHKSWREGTSMGRFAVQYEQALLGTEQPGEEWVQFDITGIHMLRQEHTDSYNLTRDGQKLVQLLLAQEFVDNRRTLVIKDIQVVEREARRMPIKMPCGKDAIIRSEYNPLEWDYYGKFGTFQRSWNRVTWDIGEGIEETLFVTLPLAGVFGIIGLCVLVGLRIGKMKRRASSLAKDDAEATLLEEEYTDEPPAYDDVPQIVVSKEED